jgi:hypothetical protein
LQAGGGLPLGAYAQAAPLGSEGALAASAYVMTPSLLLEAPQLALRNEKRPSASALMGEKAARRTKSFKPGHPTKFQKPVKAA